MKKVLFEIRMSRIYILAFLWLLLAVAMTVGFWFRWYYAFPTLALMGIASYKACKQIYGLTKDDNPIKINGWILLLIFGVIPLWLLAIGTGGFLGQELGDNAWRNAVLYELMMKPWPVTQDVDGQLYYLSYYFTYWLPSALIAKIGGYHLNGGNLGLVVSAWIWVSLTVLMVIHYCKRRAFLVGILILVFKAPIIICWLIFQYKLGWYDMDECIDPVVFGSPSMIYDSIFIYNQTLPVVLAIPLMIRMWRRPAVVAMILSMIYYYGPLETLPLIPVVALLVFRNIRCFKSCEIWSAIIMALLMTGFYMGNTNGTSLKWIWQSEFSDEHIIAMAVMYLIFTLGIFLPFIWKRVRYNAYFWTLLISTYLCMLILPQYGNFDFGWKCPVALMFIFSMEMVYVCANIKWKGHRARCSLLSLILVTGVCSDFNLYNEMGLIVLPHFLPQHYEVRKRHLGNCGHLFDEPDTQLKRLCQQSFISRTPTFYSRYLMPESATLEYEH